MDLLVCRSADPFPDLISKIKVLFAASYSLGAEVDTCSNLLAPAGSLATWYLSLSRTCFVTIFYVKHLIVFQFEVVYTT